jgi:hypothetical protein
MPELYIPKTQLDALPLIDADTASSPGGLEIIGGRVCKYWSPAATGINGTYMITDPLAAGSKLMMLSNWLDVRGCTAFQLVVTRRAVDAGNDKLHGIGITPQYRDAAGNVGLTGNAGLATQGQIGAITTIVNPLAPLGYPWVNTFGYQLVRAAMAYGSVADNTIMGNKVRLWFSDTTSTLRAGETFSLEIYGQAGPATRWP